MIRPVIRTIFIFVTLEPSKVVADQPKKVGADLEKNIDPGKIADEIEKLPRSQIKSRRQVGKVADDPEKDGAEPRKVADELVNVHS